MSPLSMQKKKKKMQRAFLAGFLSFLDTAVDRPLTYLAWNLQTSELQPLWGCAYQAGCRASPGSQSSQALPSEMSCDGEGGDGRVAVDAIDSIVPNSSLPPNLGPDNAALRLLS